MNKIFLDNASTTKINSEVNKLVYEINENEYFNPSAMYHEGIFLTEKIEKARETLANILNVNSKSIIFTSGATEANNLAINGSLTGKKDAEYIFSKGEHPSVYNVAKNLEAKGLTVKYVNLNDDGTVNLEELKQLINENTRFVSIMFVSNETGAINDIETIGNIIKEKNSQTIFHVDGVQGFGKLNIDLTKAKVDAFTLSAHKFHGPKGVGALYYKNINSLKPQILGGGQQNNLRSGTENVSGILGLELASKIAYQNLNENFEKVKTFRNIFIDQIKTDLNNVSYSINESDNNSPYILSVSFKGLKSEIIMHLLEDKNIIIGTGSACSSKKEGNRILESMHKNKEYIKGNVRISFSSFNTIEEVESASKIFTETIKELNYHISK